MCVRYFPCRHDLKDSSVFPGMNSRAVLCCLVCIPARSTTALLQWWKKEPYIYTGAHAIFSWILPTFELFPRASSYTLNKINPTSERFPHASSFAVNKIVNFFHSDEELENNETIVDYEVTFSYVRSKTVLCLYLCMYFFTLNSVV